MTDFGDFDPDDAFDREPPDPEQVAVKLAALYALHGPLEHLAVAVALVAWLRRQGAIG